METPGFEDNLGSNFSSAISTGITSDEYLIFSSFCFLISISENPIFMRILILNEIK